MKYIRNFRDLGGISVQDGRVVKHGYFYRCATLQEASKEDIEEIQTLGIRTAFDFRDPVEEFPNEGEIYAAANLTRRNYPMALNNEKLFKLQQNRGIRALFARITLEDVKDTYRSLPFDNEGYRAVFKAMQEGNVPFLFHCSAGKDRTGVCAFLILTLLGASEERILDDYMISLKIRDYVAQQAGREIPKLVRSYMLKRLEALLIVDPALLAAAKEEVLKRYGSFEEYFLKEYGINAEERERLIAIYTEARQ